MARENSLRWFEGALLKSGTPQTNVVNLATALHRDALALKLDRTPGWTSQVFQAIRRWPDNMSLWHEWERIYCNLEGGDSPAAARAFYERNRTAMDEGAELLWPELEDLYTLMRMRVEGGRTAFEREKQGSPLSPDACEWPADYFDEHVWFDRWPSDLRLKVMVLDPSKGRDSRRGDYSAFVLLGVDRDGVLYVDADLAHARRPRWWPPASNSAGYFVRTRLASRLISSRNCCPTSSPRSFSDRKWSTCIPGASTTG